MDVGEKRRSQRSDARMRRPNVWEEKLSIRLLGAKNFFSLLFFFFAFTILFQRCCSTHLRGFMLNSLDGQRSFFGGCSH